mmetsp:Transcript_24826/g.49474  ORF Transcript_24826/g.49474 Transcript_24826/m.49474 type:complete len:518 (-) Transcript_24826:75-1628(-)
MSAKISRFCIALVAMGLTLFTLDIEEIRSFLPRGGLDMADTTWSKTALRKYFRYLNRIPAKMKEEVPQNRSSSNTPINPCDNININATATTAIRQNNVVHPHDYSIIIVHYHKTGYVLSRFLTKEVVTLEYEARGLHERAKKAKMTNEYYISGYDEDTGEQIIFSRVGSWNRNAFDARRHDRKTNCPTGFSLEKSAIYLQESPDFFCSDEDLTNKLLGILPDGEILKMKETVADDNLLHNKLEDETKGTKIIHLVRNPFDMALSNYFYHSQDPTPEIWVHADNPCQNHYADGETLAYHVMPTLTMEIDGAPATKITRYQLESVTSMCRSIFRSSPEMSNLTFYEHLMTLNKWDGLRLATAQMIVASSKANNHLAGGDVLRMANNLIRFKRLRSPSTDSIPKEKREKLLLLTMSMDEYIQDTKDFVIDFHEFIFGRGNVTVSREQIVKAAEERALNAEKVKVRDKQHVTSGKHDDKYELKARLRQDPILGPILNETELLVHEALRSSKQFLSFEFEMQ